jgi:hypothetical protein
MPSRKIDRRTISIAEWIAPLLLAVPAVEPDAQDPARRRDDTLTVEMCQLPSPSWPVVDK